MKKGFSRLTLFVILLSTLCCAQAEDYSGSTMQYINVIQSHSLAKVGETVEVYVEIAGRDKPYKIMYCVYCDSPLQQNSFNFADIHSGQILLEEVRYDYPEHNYMTLFRRYVPTEEKLFVFTPKHRGHYYVSVFATDANGLEYYSDTSLILVYDEQDIADSGSEYNMAVRVIRDTVKSGMTDREVAVALHDWLVDNTRIGDWHSYESVLVTHQGFCNQYAKAYEFLCSLAGLKCVFFRSEPMMHAWNIVWIEGQWLHVDCMWDDSEAAGKTRPISHRYLLLTSKEMAKDHTWTTYPNCMRSPYPGLK